MKEDRSCGEQNNYARDPTGLSWRFEFLSLRLLVLVSSWDAPPPRAPRVDAKGISKVLPRRGYRLGQVKTKLARGYYCPQQTVILSSSRMNPPMQPRREPRRSKRLILSVPIHVLGQDVFRESFNEFTRTRSVNAYGGSLALAARVEKGRRILVINRNTGEEQECRVACVGLLREGKWTVGIEFSEPAENFWRIRFPASTPGQASDARTRNSPSPSGKRGF